MDELLDLILESYKEDDWNSSQLELNFKVWSKNDLNFHFFILNI